MERFVVDDRGLPSTVGLAVLVAVAVLAVAAVGVFGFGLVAESTRDPAPTTAFEVTFEPGSGVVTVTHASGDTIDDSNTDRLAVVVTDASAGERHELAWRDAGDGYPVASGDTLTVEDDGPAGVGTTELPFTFAAADTVEVVWRSGDDSAVLASDSLGTDSESDSPFAPGLRYDYYEADDEYTSLPDFEPVRPEKTGIVDTPTLTPRERGRDFAFRYTGVVEVPTDGSYRFYTDSDDGSRLFVDGQRVVDNPGLHASRERSGTVSLTEGRHEMTVTYFEHTGQERLSVSWSGPGFGREPIPPANLSHRVRPVADFTVDCAGLECTFDAGDSRYPGNELTGYEWTVGDGTSATGERVTHGYDADGRYDVSLTVTGEDGTTDTVDERVTVESLRPADSPGSTAPGLAYGYYEATDAFESLSEVPFDTPDDTGTVPNVDLAVRSRDTDFAVEFTGYVEAPTTGTYEFATVSDDGSRLYVGSELVVDNPGVHPARERSGTVGLAAGKHRVRVVYFEHTGRERLDLFWDGPGFDRERVPDSALFRDD
jgi:PKD repeat protein/FlaG/FlaF family flagellin (archaellin)